MMKISYDETVDALYISFIDEPRQVTTQRLTEDIAVNYGPDGEVVGIEVLAAREHIFKKEDNMKVILENLQAA
jgi:uncharacterized protein YuzE